MAHQAPLLVFGRGRQGQLQLLRRHRPLHRSVQAEEILARIRQVRRGPALTADLGTELSEAYRLGAFSESIALRTGVDDEAPLRLQVFDGGAQTPFELRSGASLHLDGPLTAVAPTEDQVDLRAAAGAVEARGGTIPRRADGVLDCQSLPTCTGDRMPQNRLLVREAE